MKPITANCISQEKSEMFDTEDYGHANNQKVLSLCSESDVHYPKGKDSQVYVWSVSPLWTRSKERSYGQKESKKIEDIEKVSEFCLNRRTKKGLQLCLRELCRVGTLGTAKWTSEKKECNYVYAEHELKYESNGTVSKMSVGSERNESERLGPSVSMVVDTFVDESARRNIAASISIPLFDYKDLEMLDYFYECIAEFGFEHIIVIGEVYYGLIFLDSYGQVFRWEDTQQVILPLGNSLEEAESNMKSDKRLDQAWTAEYGDVMYTLPDYDSVMAEQARKEKQALKGE